MSLAKLEWKENVEEKIPNIPNPVHAWWSSECRKNFNGMHSPGKQLQLFFDDRH